MRFVLPSLAAISFASGGYFMKLSNGAGRLAPTIGFLALFCVGALLQAAAMKKEDLGSIYLLVLGLEAALALVFSVIVLGERLTLARLGAAALIVGGMILLDRG
jgi:quaternary ammonium compound-resistance protein SugE